MKKRVIIGVLLIVLAIGSTVAMNTVKITYGFEYGSHYTFYPDGHYNYGYNSDGYYTHSYETGDLTGGFGTGKINPYCFKMGGREYINETGIFFQIILGIMFIVGTCIITTSVIMYRIKEEQKK